MGLDISSHVVLGVRVARRELIQQTVLPLQCAKGHPRPSAEMAFCPQDGTSFAERTVEGPTPPVAAYLAARGFEEHGVEALYDVWQGSEFGVRPINTIQPVRGPDVEYAFGVCLAKTQSHRSNANPYTTTLTGIEEATARVLAEAALLGLEGRPAELFLCVYFSA